MLLNNICNDVTQTSVTNMLQHQSLLSLPLLSLLLLSLLLPSLLSILLLSLPSLLLLSLLLQSLLLQSLLQLSLLLLRAAVGHFSKKSSCNGVFVAFLVQWEPNGDQIGPSKMKNENLRLKKLKYTCHFYIFIIFYSGLSFLSPKNNHILTFLRAKSHVIQL